MWPGVSKFGGARQVARWTCAEDVQVGVIGGDFVTGECRGGVLGRMFVVDVPVMCDRGSARDAALFA